MILFKTIFYINMSGIVLFGARWVTFEFGGHIEKLFDILCFLDDVLDAYEGPFELTLALL